MTERATAPVIRKAEPMASRSPWWERITRPGILCIVLAVTTLAVFLPVVRHGYVNYDDSDYVTANTHVQSGLKWQNVIWAFKSGHASNWHPLTWISHMLDLQTFGDKPGAQHLVSVGFHIANALLVFLLLRRLTGALWRSFVVAALFALHPLHVESVAWVSERKDVLSALFFLLTLGAYVRYAEARAAKDGWQGLETGGEKSEDRNPKSDARNPMALGGGQIAATAIVQNGSRTIQLTPSTLYLLSLGFFTLGLMSKPMVVTLPFVLLLLDYWPLHRFQLSTENSKRKTLIRLLLEKLPFFALVSASSVVTFIVQRKGGAVSTSISLGARVANALVAYVRYVRKMFWPNDLSVLYPHPSHWPAWQVAAAGALLLAICAVVIVLARRQPFLAIGWFWFCGTLVPVIGLVQVGIQSMADRYTYLPLTGLFIMMIWGLAEWVPNRPWRTELLAAGGLSVLAACTLLTARQIQFWRNSETLFGHAVKVTRGNYLAYNNLGFYLNGLGRTAEAMKNYRQALKINPAYEDALNNLGYALAGQKKYQEAIPLYEAALRVRPNHVEVHNNLGNALSETGKIDEAIKHYLVVLQQQPDHADANNNLAIALAMQGKLDEAIPHFQAALRSNPKYASAHSNLGNAFAVQHKLDEAIREYREALRLKPEDAQAHNNLGNALAEQGKLDEAVAHYREALRLNADNPEACFNLGMVLVRQGKREEAVTHLTEALRLKSDYVEARKQLGALTGRSQP
jgi:protein O-mannosyl-transferase